MRATITVAGVDIAVVADVAANVAAAAVDVAAFAILLLHFLFLSSFRTCCCFSRCSWLVAVLVRSFIRLEFFFVSLFVLFFVFALLPL